MTTPSRMCWCDDMECRFIDPRLIAACPTPRPLWAEENGYDKQAVDATEKWNGRLFTCSPALTPKW